MSVLLSRLGAYSFRRPLTVLGVWLVLVIGVIGLLQTADTQIRTSITVDDTPAQGVLDTVQREVPEAGGTQGTIVFEAADGGRVDQGAPAMAIAEAVRSAEDTAHVVDRTARMAEQEAELEEEVSQRAFEQAGEQLDEQLGELQLGLEDAKVTIADRRADIDGQLASLELGQPPRLEPWQREQQGALDLAGSNPAAMVGLLTELESRLAEQQAQLGEMDAALDAAVEATGEEKLDDVAALTRQVSDLADANPEGADLLRGSMSDDAVQLLAGDTDPKQQVSDAVANQVSEVTAQLDQFQRGLSPEGAPLVVDGAHVPGVTVSADGTIAVYEIQLTQQLDELPPGDGDELLAVVDAVAGPADLNTYPSSSLLPIEPPVGGHELVGVLVAAVVLVITLGSLVAAGLPIMTALVGVFIGVGGAFGLSEFYPMTSTTPVLALMLGLAVGIDYALFILHKQRTLIRHHGMSAGDATARAVGTSGSAVVFAGLTVVIALLGLLLLDITFVTTMALAAAATVALAVLMSITALPALLGLVGERIVSAKARSRWQRGARHSDAGAGRRWARAVTSRPGLVVIGVVALLTLVAVPGADMRLGMPSGSAASAGSPERINADLTAAALGEGANGPLIVTVDSPEGEPDMEHIRDTLTQLGEVPGVANASLRGTNEDRTLEIYAVTPATGPMSEETEDLVHALREPGVVEGTDTLGVTGLTAINIDLSERLADAIPIYLSVVAGLSLVILLVVFRSIVIPLAATAGFLLTIGATMGITTSVFGTGALGWIAGVDRPGTVLSFLPIMATGILYGLAMDYQLFLGTAIREAHVAGDSPRDSVVNGIAHAGRVVVAAAIIMVSVFGVFVLSDDMMIRQFGLTLAVGILIDAFLIRMTLLPAVMGIAGRAAWWLPRWLDRVLPRLDVEGSTLERDTRAATPVGAVTG